MTTTTTTTTTTTKTMTTQILFNSPALHCLKRDQLVKLCKIHSVKANGKNVELIERLKQRALELPPRTYDEDERDADGGDVVMDEVLAEDHEQEQDQDPIDTHMESEPSANVDDCDMQDVVLTSRFSIPRPSEQWEVVMEDIEELDEYSAGTASSKGSLRTVGNGHGEFGTHSSKASVSSSIKALANSLGIKRGTSKSSHCTDETGSYKMPSFSPGKLFASAKARDSLAEHATPYSEIPPSDSLPETDGFKFSTPDASILVDEDADGAATITDDAGSIGRSSSRPGVSIGAGGVRSTIRLVSHPAASKSDYHNYAYMSPPRLPVVKTDFELTVGTPGTVRTLTMWPATPGTAAGDTESLYPKLPLAALKPMAADGADEDDEGEVDQMPGGMDMPMTTPAKTRPPTSVTQNGDTPAPIDEPDMFSPSKPSAMSNATASTPGPPAVRGAISRSTPFLFGSPLPKRELPAVGGKSDAKEETTAGVSKDAFDAVAASVLEEMHRRLAEANAQKGKDGETKQQPSAFPTQPLFSGLAFGAPANGATGEAQDRFAKAHEATFNKMDSIATHYAARRPNKRKSDALGGRPLAGQKRRSSAAGARVISAGSRKKMALPGGFAAEGEDESGEDEEGEDEPARADDDDDDAGARRSSKRMRITEGWDVHRGQRVSLAPPVPGADEEKKAKEQESVKRALDAAKARRRSSRGRSSIGVAPVKAKSSRFGFLSSAKSLVRNVWNIGGGSKAKSTTAGASASSIPVPKASQPPTAATRASIDKTKPAVDVASKPTIASNARKVSGSHSRNPSVSSTTSTTKNSLLKPPGVDTKTGGTSNSIKSISSRQRSPIPLFPVPTSTLKTTGSTSSKAGSLASTARSWMSSTKTGTAASRQTTRTSNVSSMGTRTSTGGSSTAASSIGVRRSIASRNLASTNSKAEPKASVDTAQPSIRKHTSSLLAPTASSLAKVNTSVKPLTSGRTSGLASVAESQIPKRTSVTRSPPLMSKASLLAATNSPMSPRPTRIFSQPLTNHTSPASSSGGATPVHHPSLNAVATSIMGTDLDPASSPSKIPRPAVLPPKPKQLVARKPRISRSKVIAKLGAQRAAAAQGLSYVGSPTSRARKRSSVGSRRSFGGVKSARASGGSDVLRNNLKKRARQSEYMRRKSRATSENTPLAVDA